MRKKYRSMPQRLQSLVAAERGPRNETTGSRTPALELETELLELIIHHPGDLLNFFLSLNFTI